MNDHYYTATPTSAHNLQTHEVRFLDLDLSFVTDSGVFSKDGMDPGSALLLRSLPPLFGRVLDMGCGWGALGVTLGKKYPDARLIMADVNERAVALSRENLDKNGVRNAEVHVSDGFERVEGTFDFVVTNPPIRAGKQVIYKLFEEAMERLNPGGALWLVIRKQQGAPSALKFLQSLSPATDVAEREKGYWILRAPK